MIFGQSFLFLLYGLIAGVSVYYLHKASKHIVYKRGKTILEDNKMSLSYKSSSLPLGHGRKTSHRVTKSILARSRSANRISNFSMILMILLVIIGGMSSVGFLVQDRIEALKGLESQRTILLSMIGSLDNLNCLLDFDACLPRDLEYRNNSSATRLPISQHPRNIILERNRIEDILEKPSELLTQATMIPYLENGRHVGMSITGIKLNSLFRKMRLRNGDILVKADNEQIQNLADFQNFFKKIESSLSATLHIQRRGRKQAINYSIISSTEEFGRLTEYLNAQDSPESIIEAFKNFYKDDKAASDQDEMNTKSGKNKDDFIKSLTYILLSEGSTRSIAKDIKAEIKKISKDLPKTYGDKNTYKEAIDNVERISNISWPDIAARVTIALLTLFLVQIFFSVYRFNRQLSSILSAKAEALELIGQDKEDEKLLRQELVATVKESTPGFGPIPKTFLQEAIDFANKLKDKIHTG